MEFPSFSKGNVIFIVVVDRASRAGLNESFLFFDLFFHLLVHFRVKYYPQLHGNPKKNNPKRREGEANHQASNGINEC